MDYLLNFLNELIGNPEYSRLAFLTLTGLTVLALALALGFLLIGLSTPVRRRLQALKRQSDYAPERQESAAIRNRHEDPLAQRLLPAKQWQNSQLKSQLVHAGLRSDSAVSLFYAARILLTTLLPICVFFGAQLLPDATTRQVMLYTLAAAGVGFILPGWLLQRQADKRKERLRNAFPDALDLLVVCVESGLGLTAAIARVSDELEISHPELAEELNLVSAEIRAGVDRVRAMRNLAARTGLDEIRGLVALLDQTLRFGTSIAGTLRVYSEEFRDKRIQRAEEVAATIGTKMIFPLTLCLWPAFFLIVIGPAVLGVLEMLQQS